VDRGGGGDRPYIPVSPAIYGRWYGGAVRVLSSCSSCLAAAAAAAAALVSRRTSALLRSVGVDHQPAAESLRGHSTARLGRRGKAAPVSSALTVVGGWW
jgi:hypothetical protein